MSILKKARGSILVMSTLILSILAGLSISTIQNVVTEYQLTAQNQDKTLALQAAQYAISEAKRLLLSNWSTGAPVCSSIAGCTASNGIAVWSYSAFAGTSDLSKQAPTFFNNAQATTSSPNPTVAASPRFFVIDLGCDAYSKSNIYRIAALGFGASLRSVAYAESQLTMPLSGQNSYSGAATLSVPALLNGTQVSTYSLAPSTSSKTLFFNNTAPSSCPQGTGTGATCEMNCLREVRVKAYSYFNTNNTSCPWIYGDWVAMNSGNLSQLTMTGSGGVAHTVSCRAASSVSNCTSAQNLSYACCLANLSKGGPACTAPTGCTVQSVSCPACNANTNVTTACCDAKTASTLKECMTTYVGSCVYSPATCPACSEAVTMASCGYGALYGIYTFDPNSTALCIPSACPPPPDTSFTFTGPPLGGIAPSTSGS